MVQCTVKSSSYSQVRLKTKATAIKIKVGGGVLANGSLLLSVRKNRTKGHGYGYLVELLFLEPG